MNSSKTSKSKTARALSRNTMRSDERKIEKKTAQKSKSSEHNRNDRWRTRVTMFDIESACLISKRASARYEEIQMNERTDRECEVSHQPTMCGGGAVKKFLREFTRNSEPSHEPIMFGVFHKLIFLSVSPDRNDLLPDFLSPRVITHNNSWTRRRTPKIPFNHLSLSKLQIDAGERERTAAHLCSLAGWLAYASISVINLFAGWTCVPTTSYG